MEFSQDSETVELFNLAGFDALIEQDVDKDDTHSGCSTVYTVGDVSLITNDNSDDVACIDDVEDDDLVSDLDEFTPEENLNESPNADQSTCPGYVLVIDNICIFCVAILKCYQ